MRPALALLTACAVLIAVPVAAQLLPGVALPQVPVAGPVTQGLEQTLDRPLETIRESAEQLVQARTDRIDELLRRQREFVEPDANGEPAVRGELLLVDPDPATLAAARSAGFADAGADRFGSLGINVVRLQLPQGMALAEAQRLLRRAAPTAEIASDNLHFQSGGVGTAAPASAVAAPLGIATLVGVIDGGPGKGEAVAAMPG